jgi:hypothetical protein
MLLGARLLRWVRPLQRILRPRHSRIPAQQL